MTSENPAAPEPVNPAENRTKNFIFHGEGFEYFKIWIVNILLTILTLGIYSAWAKVRNLRYFYGNMEVDNHRFEYLASPLAILKGRLLAIAVFIIWTVLFQIMPLLGLLLSLVFMFATPWLIIRSLAFHHSMTAYRNIRFNFNADYREAFLVFTVWPLLAMFTLGILAPKAMAEFNRFRVNHSRYGTQPFTFTASTKDYIIMCLVMLIIFIAGTTLFTLLLPSGALSDNEAIRTASVIGLSQLILGATYAVTYIYFTVKSTNIFYNNVHLGDIHFQSEIPAKGLTLVLLTNGILILLTLGLYLPAAKVRLAKFYASHISLDANSELNTFIAAEQQKQSAIGQEIGDVLDIEIAAF